MNENHLLSQLRNSFAGYDQHKRADAAVLVGICDSPDPTILLTLRASHMNSHAGEVALPGGKVDREDGHPANTALRESHEEVGLLPSHVEILGQLGNARAKSGISVMPIIGLIHGQPHLTGNPDEIADVFRVPLSFFFESKPQRDYQINFRGVDLHVPCFRYEDYVIWGLTARIIVDFMAVGFNHQIDYPWPPVMPSILLPNSTIVGST